MKHFVDVTPENIKDVIAFIANEHKCEVEEVLYSLWCANHDFTILKQVIESDYEPFEVCEPFEEDLNDFIQNKK